MHLLQTLKNQALPVAIIIGVIAYPLVSYLSFLTPYLIFTMLLLTFCKLSPRDISLRPAHIWLLLIQLVGCLFVYGALWFYHPVVAQGAFICVLVPTATAAAVITGLLGGNVAFLTTYLLLCNTGVALVAPVLLPLVGAQHAEVSFIEAFLRICRQVAPVLLSPLLLAWVIRYVFPEVNRKIVSIHKLSFYLWVTALTIVTGKTMKFLVEQENPDYRMEAGLALVSLIICVCQFLLGRRIGRHYGDPISCGQGLGQKNTILAIWIAQAYLHPLSSVAPAAYVLWQNIINSWQLWKKRKKNA
ncbi:MAG: transporter [Tannerellaceae bacterium]|jgi:BASS family bile acid:Na+ symporter|nr:transporter [Tannerellaceae bacterium]